MAVKLTVDIVDPDGEIKVSHIFWGDTEDDVETWKAHHLKSCEYYAAAERDGRTLEELECIDDDERPEVEEEEEEDDG
jgi:hypothetical protein